MENKWPAVPNQDPFGLGFGFDLIICPISKNKTTNTIELFGYGAHRIKGRSALAFSIEASRSGKHTNDRARPIRCTQNLHLWKCLPSLELHFVTQLCRHGVQSYGRKKIGLTGRTVIVAMFCINSGENRCNLVEVIDFWIESEAECRKFE